MRSFAVLRQLVAFVLVLACSHAHQNANAKPDVSSDVRILFLTDCTPYSDWMSIALVYSYLYSGHKGPITRVMCCNDEDRKRYKPDLLALVETHIAPSMRVSKRTGDNYPAYDKPGAVIDYIHRVAPPENWLLVLDSDMIVRRPVRTKDYNVSLGWAVGNRYDCMLGVNNKLADRHIPEIPRRNDTLAGPAGRRSDMVGGFVLIHKTDLKRLSKMWLQYAEDVRADPEAYKYAGDHYALKPGVKPWISEMYGYSYAAAKANVWHHWDETTMLYPGYNPSDIPKLLHFGLQWSVQNHTFDKHWYMQFDARKCAPWDLSRSRPLQGLFPHPPRPRDLTSKTFEDRYRDLIGLEGMATLNAGLCWWHRKRCPPSAQMERECSKAEQIFFEVREALRLAEDVFDCVDTQTQCRQWAARGECTKTQFYMSHHCRPSCKLCTPKAITEGILGRLTRVKGERMVPQEIPNPAVMPPEFEGRVLQSQGTPGDGVVLMARNLHALLHDAVPPATRPHVALHPHVPPRANNPQVLRRDAVPPATRRPVALHPHVPPHASSPHVLRHDAVPPVNHYHYPDKHQLGASLPPAPVELMALVVVVLVALLVLVLPRRAPRRRSAAALSSSKPQAVPHQAPSRHRSSAVGSTAQRWPDTLLS